jgi:hypothetical protein
MVLAIVAVAAFVVTFMVASRDDDADRPEGALDLENLDALTVEARELVALAERGGQVAHHAVYDQSGGNRFEVWTDGARTREETTPADDGERRLLLRTDDEALTCVEEADAWSCDAAATTDVGVEGQLTQLVADLLGAEVAISDAKIADLDVQCFAVTGGDGDVEICLTAEGVLARLAAGDDQLELVSLDDDVDDSRFDPPE